MASATAFPGRGDRNERDVPSNDSLHIATRLAQGGHFVDGATGAIVPPIQSSTTFARDESYALPSEFSYARADNPNAHLLERLLADLEGGADSLVFGSGMAGISTLLESVPGGKRIAALAVMYHGTRDWMRHIAGQGYPRIGLTHSETAICRLTFIQAKPHWCGSKRRSIQPGC